MFHTGKQHILVGIKEIFGFHDCRHRLGQIVTEEFQTDALFLDTRQAAKELVSHIFTQTAFTQFFGWNRHQLRLTEWRFTIGFKPGDAEMCGFDVVDLAQIVIQTFYFHPGCFWGHHAPRHQVIQRGSPHDGFFTTGVHRYITTDSGGILRSRINSEYQPVTISKIGNTTRHHTRFSANSRHIATIPSR
ncbi:hypothetical protein COL154_013899 [Colletotrichum chrysophilum]|nr:hypothetical protein COL154_013899 [Colletotrichum chrysophilum]